MTSVTWGLPEKKSAATSKCFNIAARVQKSSVEQSLSCRLHPVAVLKILDAFVRRKEGETRAIGTLVGWISEGSIVDITDCFPVVHRDNDEGTVLMDQEYHKSMLQLRQRTAPREQVVGWFSTGNEIKFSSAVIHNFYGSRDSQFTATAVLPTPVHLLVDTSMAQSSGIKAFINVKTVMAESLLQFHEVPIRVQTSASEKGGTTQLMHARRAGREASANGSVPAELGSMDGFEGGLRELLALFRRVQEYVRAVGTGKVEGDLAVGRGLTAALSAEPIIDSSAVEQLCHNSQQDALMVVYLSNLAKTQIAIAEKINAVYREP